MNFHKTASSAVGILLLLSLAGCSSASHRAQGSVRELIGTTLEGDTARLAASHNSRLAVVFYNEYSCKDCFSRIDSALNTMMQRGFVERTAVLIRVGNSAFSQHEAQKLVRHLMHADITVLFDIVPDDVVDPWPPRDLKGGFFGRFDVTKTPALLVLDSVPGRTAFLNYEALEFGDTSDESVSEFGRKLFERVSDRFAAAR